MSDLIAQLKEILPTLKDSLPVELKRVNGKEWAGPCIVCQGKDRLRYFTDKDTIWCRQCDLKMDVIDFYREKEGGISIKELAEKHNLIQPQPQPSAKKSKHTPAWGYAKEKHPSILKYFAARNINFSDDFPLPPAVRWSSWRDKKTGQDIHSILFAVTKPTDTAVKATQRTFLDADHKKTNRVMKGTCKGRGIFFYRSRIKEKKLIIGEGAETVLSAMQATGINGVSGLDAGKMLACPIPDTVEELFILVDEDKNFAGQRAALSLAEKFGRGACLVTPSEETFSSEPGKLDFNDLATEGILHRFSHSQELSDITWRPPEPEKKGRTDEKGAIDSDSPKFLQLIDEIAGAYPSLKFDKFFQATFIDDKELTDHRELEMRKETVERVGYDIAALPFHDAIDYVAYSRRKHFMRDYFNALPAWDGEDRISGLADMLSGTEDELFRVYMKKWLLGAAARTFMCNELVKNMLILAGSQDVGKSSFFMGLIPPGPEGFAMFNDSVMITTLKNKAPDFWQSTQGCLICEFAELVGNKKENVNALKNMLSAQAPRGRVAYGRRVQNMVISTIFCGTTNDNNFLRDSTGNVRFYIIPCQNKIINKGKIRAARDQIWSQVLEAFRSGEKHWIPAGEFKDLQAAHNLDFVKLTLATQRFLSEVEDNDISMYIPSAKNEGFTELMSYELDDAMMQMGWVLYRRMSFLDKISGKIKKSPACWVCPNFFNDGIKKSEIARSIFSYKEGVPVPF